MNLEARLSKLEREVEQQNGAPRAIVLYRDQDEDLDAILTANNLTTAPHDLVISLARGSGERRPINQRIISIHERAA